MKEEKFWGFIEKFHSGKDLKECLAPLSEEDLFGFRYWWEYFCNLSYRQDLWAVAYTFWGSCSEAMFDAFRFWLISRGKDVFYQAMENPDSLCDVFSNEDSDYPQKDGLDYVVMEILEERTGDEDYYDKVRENYSLPEKKQDISFEWSWSDINSIKKICPRTFEKWLHDDIVRCSKREKFKLEKNIPVLDEKTKEFVRNLTENDLSETLSLELKHDNILEILLDSQNRLKYKTKESSCYYQVDTKVLPKLGYLGRFEIDMKFLQSMDNNWQDYAAVIAINLGNKYIEEHNIYFNSILQSVWEVTDDEHADNSVTIFTEDEERTYCFRRIWLDERHKRGIPDNDSLFNLE